jgi:hypothetical protein
MYSLFNMGENGKRRNVIIDYGNPENVRDRSTHPTVVAFALKKLYRGGTPTTAARSTEKTFAGKENIMFFGPGVSKIHVPTLVKTMWASLADSVISSMKRFPPGKEHFALDGVVRLYKLNQWGSRRVLKKLVVEKLGSNPFTNDDGD